MCPKENDILTLFVKKTLLCIPVYKVVYALCGYAMAISKDVTVTQMWYLK